MTYSHEYAILVTVALPDAIVWAKSRTVGGAPLPVSLHLHDLGGDGGRTQILFRVGDGWVEDAVVVWPRPDHLPAAGVPLHIQPNLWTRVFRVEAEPVASVGILALPRSSVRMGRTGVWRPREGLHRDIAPGLHEALRAGRRGVLRPGSARGDRGLPIAGR